VITEYCPGKRVSIGNERLLIGSTLGRMKYCVV
jgi:hypothetical protein